MGLRGPAPKPTALKAAAGNPGRRRLNEGEPAPPVGEIRPPAWLSKRARAVWSEAAPICIAMRTLTTADVNAFARYCTTFARWVLVQRKLDHEDDAKAIAATTYALKSETGKLRCLMETPYMHQLSRMHRELKDLEDRFGLTPAARSRIRVGTDAAGAVAPTDPSSMSVPGARLTELMRRKGVIATLGPGDATQAHGAG